jgi:hypothetical protein
MKRGFTMTNTISFNEQTFLDYQTAMPMSVLRELYKQTEQFAKHENAQIAEYFQNQNDMIQIIILNRVGGDVDELQRYLNETYYIHKLSHACYRVYDGVLIDELHDEYDASESDLIHNADDYAQISYDSWKFFTDKSRENALRVELKKYGLKMTYGQR